MWEYEHSVETTATPEAVYALWADVANWGKWDSDAASISIDGAFVPGSEITMVTGGGDTVVMRVVEVVANELFIDEANVNGLVIRSTHRVGRQDDGRTKVTHRLEITGEAADKVGPQLGPQITGDWDKTMAALVAVAAG